MKKLNKILSSVLAASVIVSACAMNVFAASKAHTATLSASKTEGLKAGETIVVSIDLDNIGGLISCQYDLNFDPKAFEIDTAKDQKIGMKKYENFLEIEWYKHITNDEESPFAAFISAPTLGYDATNGRIALQWAGSDGNTDPDYALDDYTIGKFNIKVKADAPDGEYNFTLTNCKTGDAGENSTADITCTPITVTVGEPAPAQSNVNIDDAAATFTDDTFTVNEKTYRNAGAMFEFAVTENTIAPIKSISMTATDNLNNTNDFSLKLPVEIKKVGSAKVALNILNVPTDVTSITLTNIVTSAN